MIVRGRARGQSGAQRTARREVLGNVAVHEPVPGALRHPLERHRARAEQWLRDGEIAGRRVHGAVAAARDAEVEPVQMHRMQIGARVDHAPAYRVADRVGQPLRMGPRATVDHREHALATRAGAVDRVAPRADHEDAVVRPHAGGVHDDRAGELGVLVGAQRDRPAHRRAPVEVGARQVEPEPHLARLAGREHERHRVRAQRAYACEQAVHAQRVVERVAYANRRLGPRGHANERPGDARRTVLLGERHHRRAGRVVAVAGPVGDPRDDSQREHAVPQRAGGDAVVVGHDAVEDMRRRVVPHGRAAHVVAARGGNEREKGGGDDRRARSREPEAHAEGAAG